MIRTPALSGTVFLARRFWEVFRVVLARRLSLQVWGRRTPCSRFIGSPGTALVGDAPYGASLFYGVELPYGKSSMSYRGYGRDSVLGDPP